MGAHACQQLLESGRKNGEGGLSFRSVRLIHTVIHRALRDAVRWSLVTRNVADLADPPRAVKQEMKCWTAQEARKFLTAVEGDRLAPLFTLALTTGMRRGELLGLHWQDVDFAAGRLSVRRARIAVGYKVIPSAPKTQRSRRSIALDATTLSTLRSLRKIQLEERLAWGTAYEQTDLVFVNENGTAPHPQHVSTHFRRLAARAGVPAIRFHDLRHTFATLALAAGIHPKVVSERLGHSSVAITLDIYSHVLPDMQEDAATRIATSVFGIAN